MAAIETDFLLRVCLIIKDKLEQEKIKLKSQLPESETAKRTGYDTTDIGRLEQIYPLNEPIDEHDRAKARTYAGREPEKRKA